MSTTAYARGKQLTRVAAGLVAFALASSVLATPFRNPLRAPHHAPGMGAPPQALQVVVLALDGVRYQDVFAPSAAELMPRLYELMHQQGAALGAPGVGFAISATGPDFVSLPGYSEMLTGSSASGCENNGCSGTHALSVADELAQPSRGGWHTAIVSSWPDIARVAAKSQRVAVSSGRHGGATRDWFSRSAGARAALTLAESVAPWPGHGDFRRDRFTAELALSYLRERAPSFLFVSLGEPDEFAHQGNHAGYLDALRHADQCIGELQAWLDQRAQQGVKTALFITTDHGRADNFRDHGHAHPESARVWLAAYGSAIGARGLVRAPSPRQLADIAPTVRQLFGLTAEPASAPAGAVLSELLFAAKN
ncbi:MAG TPA: alkaline phosphatase family protein [Polyangiaceae bacterium]